MKYSSVLFLIHTIKFSYMKKSFRFYASIVFFAFCVFASLFFFYHMSVGKWDAGQLTILGFCGTAYALFAVLLASYNLRIKGV